MQATMMSGVLSRFAPFTALPARRPALAFPSRRPCAAWVAQQQRSNPPAPSEPQPMYLLSGLAASWLAHEAPAAAEGEEAAAAAAATALGAAEQLDFGGAAVQAAQLSDSDNLLISVLFAIAIAALTVLTLGVAYLSVTSWLDSRTEEEDRKKAGGLKPVSSGTGAGSPRGETKKEPQAAASSKGFGKKK